MFDRVTRLIGNDAFIKLQTMKVGIIGLGSGGSFVAESLAMSGVGNFVLIDPGVLKEANLIRHIATSYYVGSPKVSAISRTIHERIPNTGITLCYGTFADNTEALLRIEGNTLDPVDLLIVCVDSEAVKFQVNEWALKHRVPAIYAGVYERGIGGDVCIIDKRHTNSGPCYACWAEQLRDTSGPSDAAHTALDYGQVNERGALNAEPGLWLDVVSVAAKQAKLALNFLLHGQGSQAPNTVVTANEVMELIDSARVRPFTTEWLRVNALDNCLVCGQPSDLTVDLSDILE